MKKELTAGEANDLGFNPARVLPTGKCAGLKTLSESSGGKREMIRSLNPNMTRGETDLNELLLSGEPTAKEKIAKAGEPFAGLRSYFDQQMQQSAAARDKAVADTQAASQKVKTEFVDPQKQNLAGMRQGIDARVTGAAQDFNEDEMIRDLERYVGKRWDLYIPKTK